VLESPLRLHLQLVCNAFIPVKRMLDAWPSRIPIVIEESRPRLPRSGANIIAALKHHDRVSLINLDTTSTVLKGLYTVMTKKPYPVLTQLRLHISNSKSAPVLRDTFLGGSAPRLEYLDLTGIPFPALPKFLPSCHNLADVLLKKIPNTGYFSPEAMATALSALTKLKYIQIEFESPNSCPDPRNGPPTSYTRAVLPSLTRLEFYGTSEYFEDLVARIDTPAIITAETSFFDRLNFSIPHFLQFIRRTPIPESLEGTKLNFVGTSVYIHVGHRDPSIGKEFRMALGISFSLRSPIPESVRLAQICGKISPILTNVERLLFATRPPGYESKKTDAVFPDWKDYVDNPQWLELFHAISALQYMYKPIPPRVGEIIASALLELTGERVMDALPMLHVTKFGNNIIIYYDDVLVI
jgi:hypothetical protein